jgi:TonB family protein
MFQPLDAPPVRWSRFAPSLIGHTLLVAAVIAIPASVMREQAKPVASVTHLVDPLPFRPKPLVLKRSVRIRQPEVAKLPVPVHPVIAPALAAPRVVAPPVPVRVARAAPPVPAKIVAAPAPVLASVAVAGPVMPAPAPLAPLVRTGGFGEASGGGASGGGGGNRGTGGAGMQKVAMAGFGDVKPVAAAPMERKAVVQTIPVQTPVEITFKPKPAYTEQARAQHLEGEVQLEVVFCASGTLEVLRVVKGLGLGLDDSAREAAAHIRFHPATRGGAPIDVRGIVHIAFELS